MLSRTDKHRYTDATLEVRAVACQDLSRRQKLDTAVGITRYYSQLSTRPWDCRPSVLRRSFFFSSISHRLKCLRIIVDYDKYAGFWSIRCTHDLDFSRATRSRHLVRSIVQKIEAYFTCERQSVSGSLKQNEGGT